MKPLTAYDRLVGVWTVLAVYCVGFYYAIVELFWDHLHPSGNYIQHLKDQIKSSEFLRLGRTRSRPIAVVTGASGTIGFETVRLLLCLGYTVEALTQERGRLSSLNNDRLSVSLVDLAEPTEVRRVADKIVSNFPNGVDLVVCCAGVMLHPYKVNSLGHEQHMAVNVISHALLVYILMGALPNQDHPIRIVFVSSSTAHVGFIDGLASDCDAFSEYINGYHAYASSKLAVALYAEQLNRKIESAMCERGGGDSGKRMVTMCSVHPGCVAGHLYANVLFPCKILINRIIAPFLRSPRVAAAEVIATALSDSFVSGAYYERLKPVDLRPDIPEPVRTKLFSCIQRSIRSISA